MKHITEFESRLVGKLPETHTLLLHANLVVHDRVSRITLHGSRGLKGGARHDSDIDLSLVISLVDESGSQDLAQLLDAVLSTTLTHWMSDIEVDLVAVFDKSDCGLRCLDVETFNPQLCPSTVDCMGLYKIQKGFSGFVSGAGVDCSKMYPLMTIWRDLGLAEARELG